MKTGFVVAKQNVLLLLPLTPELFFFPLHEYHATLCGHLSSTHPNIHQLNHIVDTCRDHCDRMGVQYSLVWDMMVGWTVDQGVGYPWANLVQKSNIFHNMRFPLKLGHNNGLACSQAVFYPRLKPCIHLLRHVHSFLSFIQVEFLRIARIVAGSNVDMYVMKRRSCFPANMMAKSIYVVQMNSVNKFWARCRTTVCFSHVIGANCKSEFSSANMGVKGLWKILSPAAQEASLTELAVMEGFVPNRHGLQAIIVGIDARY